MCSVSLVYYYCCSGMREGGLMTVGISVLLNVYTISDTQYRYIPWYMIRKLVLH